MILIAINSITPGAGTTTVAANLMVAMQRLGRHAVLIDGDPRNQVRLHFGMPASDPHGWWPHSGEGLQFSDAAYVAAPPLDAAKISAHFVPFGDSASVLESDATYEYLVRHPSAFQEALQHSAIPESAVVFVTLSEALVPLQYQVLAAADFAFGVITPNPLWQLQLQRYLRSTAAARLREQQPLHVLLNQCQPELTLNNDMAQLIQAELPADMAVPLTLHHDQHVPEALALQQLVENYQSNAQFANEIDALALWLETQLLERGNAT